MNELYKFLQKLKKYPESHIYSIVANISFCFSIYSSSLDFEPKQYDFNITSVIIGIFVVTPLFLMLFIASSFVLIQSIKLILKHYNKTFLIKNKFLLTNKIYDILWKFGILYATGSITLITIYIIIRNL